MLAERREQEGNLNSALRFLDDRSEIGRDLPEIPGVAGVDCRSACFPGARHQQSIEDEWANEILR
jgi:hypothetical protein